MGEKMSLLEKFGVTWENLQPIIWITISGLLLLLPDSMEKALIVGVAITRIRRKI